MEKTNAEGVVAVYTDAQGKMHYFTKCSDGTIKDETGLGLTFTEHGNSNGDNGNSNTSNSCNNSCGSCDCNCETSCNITSNYSLTKNNYNTQNNTCQCNVDYEYDSDCH